jgi:class 3 adenylate cyclase
MTATLGCMACGAALSSSAKFCSECGSPASADSKPAEYKQVTVLFADVVHSMDIAASVGAERLREIMTELVECSLTVVRRYGGTVDKFTGDGIMAVFGAPVALEDHALRACLAALSIQRDVTLLAADVERRDAVDLRLRVGINSGQVIAGEIGSGVLGYTAIGEQVGMAQRMESVAPPGGVMISDSTARLVEGVTVLGDAELVNVKGVDQPVCARRLLSVSEVRRPLERAESSLVGRRWETAAVKGLLERATDGHGAVIGVAGSPGVGKSRLVRALAPMAAARGADVFSAYCEAHASDIPFHAVAQLLRAVCGVEGLDDAAARARVRAQAPDAEPEDLLLFDDLLSIADPHVALPAIGPDARRRRLTALINSASLSRKVPTVYVVEDVHWIDAASESMLADFVTVVPQTPSLVLLTYRSEYRGVLSHVGNAQTIALAPLSDSETAVLVSQLLGPDPSVSAMADLVAGRAAGNPFFAEEIVRDLAERGVLSGDRGGYASTAELPEIYVPATLQATIAARIDRLDAGAKRTLTAAAVIGSRFGPDLLETLGIDPVLQDLVAAELIDQTRFTGEPEYAFHHPLIRTVAYESQLKSARAELHRRVASAIESRDSAAVDEHAALIAEHLEAAGDLEATYGWHMRAATWATHRDITAARLSWERAAQIADALPDGDPDRAAMRIAPRTMLCGIAWRAHIDNAGDRFDELRELCAAAGDKASLAIAMAGLAIDRMFRDQMREGSELASEVMALIESIGDPTLTVGLSPLAIYVKGEAAEWAEVLRWAQVVIDLADGDPSKGNFIIGSPLAAVIYARGIARYSVGDGGWRDDLSRGLAMARSADTTAYVRAIFYVYTPGIANGVLRPDDRTMREIEDALQKAERSGDDLALAQARMALGVGLVHRRLPAERDRGRGILAEVREVFLHRQHNLCDLPLVTVCLAREMARRGDRGEALALMRDAVEHLFRDGRPLIYGVATTGVLVQTLLDRGTEDDVAEANSAIEHLARTPTESVVMRDIWMLRMRALLARTHGDAATYLQCRDRYRDTAKALGFEGHMEWAAALHDR